MIDVTPFLGAIYKTDAILATWVSRDGKFVLYPKADNVLAKTQAWFSRHAMPDSTNFKEYALYAILCGGKCGE